MESGAALIGLDDNLPITKSATAITEQDASRVIDNIAADWRGGNDRVSLARSYENHPANVKEEAKRQKSEGKVRGILHNDQSMFC